MKRSTKKLLWEKRGPDWAVGVIRQRGKPDLIKIRFRKDSGVRLDMDSVPTSHVAEPDLPTRDDLLAKFKQAMKSAPYLAVDGVEVLPWTKI